jgi:restriction system protein
MHSFTVHHEGLGKFQVVRGRTLEEARLKATLKRAAWDAQYQRTHARTQKQRMLLGQRAAREALKEEAAARTTEAEQAIAALGKVLSAIFEASPVFSIEQQGAIGPFGEPHPTSPRYREYPRQPKREDWTFVPKLDFWDKLFSFRRKKKLRLGQEASERMFAEDHEQWVANCKLIEQSNKELHQVHQKSVREWLLKKDEWEQQIHALKTRKADGIYWLFDNIWEVLPVPDLFSGEYQLSYDPAANILAIDLDLPEFEAIPKLKGVRYVASKNDLEEVLHKESHLRSLFDDFVYQVMLAIPYAFFSCDKSEAVQAIVLNGWVTYINRASGNKTTACIASIHCDRGELSKINLREVDAKACFRSLKGLASPQINSLTPVRPIIDLNRSDKRFVNSQNVLDEVQRGTNIAAMGWEEFEHLIRGVFEKEFSAGGGEVKVTQASGDGGVDAIAFDPDPIRGGKIVIQAKRYTNTVDVGAVRDLYGTVLNEGATKGILVTTSGFGPDAYRFAKDKPLTLLDGNNLLYLLDKHGHAARIDLSEAKQLGNALKRSS